MNITGLGTNTAARQDNEWNTDVTFKSQALLTDCANEINDVQIDNIKDPGVVMSMFNIIRIVKVILKIRKFLAASTRSAIWQ